MVQLPQQMAKIGCKMANKSAKMIPKGAKLVLRNLVQKAWLQMVPQIIKMMPNMVICCEAIFVYITVSPITCSFEAIFIYIKVIRTLSVALKPSPFTSKCPPHYL